MKNRNLNRVFQEADAETPTAPTRRGAVCQSEDKINKNLQTPWGLRQAKTIIFLVYMYGLF